MGNHLCVSRQNEGRGGQLVSGCPGSASLQVHPAGVYQPNGPIVGATFAAYEIAAHARVVGSRSSSSETRRACNLGAQSEWHRSRRAVYRRNKKKRKQPEEWVQVQGGSCLRNQGRRVRSCKSVIGGKYSPLDVVLVERVTE